MSRPLTRRSFLAALLVAGLAPAPYASAQSGRSVKTYIALGDSVAFGLTDVLPACYGDQGYVRPFPDRTPNALFAELRSMLRQPGAA